MPSSSRSPSGSSGHVVQPSLWLPLKMAREAVPEADRVKLISSDGVEFIISKKSARKSGVIRTMLGEGPSGKNGTGMGSKSTTSADTAAETAAAANAASAMTALGTPPPDAETDAMADAAATVASRQGNGGTDTDANGAAGNDDPEGYVNPFAVDDGITGKKGKNDAGEVDAMGLDIGFAEAQSNKVHLTNIRGVVLEKVVEYLDWNAKYSDAPKDIDIPPFEPRIPPDLALELLIAADYLDA